MIIKLIRHAQSEANAGHVDASIIGDHNVRLTEDGCIQAKRLGTSLVDFLQDSLIYCSPYRRTRQTLENIIEGAKSVSRTPATFDLRIYEDPRIREVEWGLGLPSGQEKWEQIERMKEDYGSFYVRRPNGESCADCFDRCSGFIESLWRQIRRKESRHVLIVSHGLTIRCFVMRFLHLTVEQFEQLRNPENCSVITIADHDIDGSQYTSGGWSVSGLRLEGELN